MPWHTQADTVKHNKQATGKKGRQWRDIANRVLERTGDDAQAIRTANGVLKKERSSRAKAIYGD